MERKRLTLNHTQTIPIEYDDTQTWRLLRHFNYYRAILASALLILFYQAVLGGFLGNYNPEAYLAINLIFLISSLFFIVLTKNKSPSFESQVILANSSDILLITLMMHFSGGLGSALGILLIVNIVGTGTFLQSRDSFLFAALATIAVLIEQTYNFLESVTTVTMYSVAGILGLVFFASSFLASTLTSRLRETEALAKQSQTELINLENLNEHIIQNMRTGILVVDEEGIIRMINSSAESLIGNINLNEQPLLENIFPALEKRFFEWQEQPQMHHKPIKQKQGLPDIQPGFQQINKHSKESGDTIIFLEDATQLNQRFQQIKLASLGKLTASIAHEIRNPLSAINHAAQLLKESDLEEADDKLAQIINTQVLRLDKIIDNVLQLSKKKEILIETIDLPNWLKSFKDEFCNSQELELNQIRIDITCPNHLILFDSSHLYQVIGNLCLNSMTHSGKKKSELVIDLNFGFDGELSQPYLDILDNGPGIENEQAQQIFDPFFTTSPKGSGLGLYISKEIVEINRGKIRYLDRNESGCCFRIYFLSASNANEHVK